MAIPYEGDGSAIVAHELPIISTPQGADARTAESINVMTRYLADYVAYLQEHAVLESDAVLAELQASKWHLRATNGIAAVFMDLCYDATDGYCAVGYGGACLTAGPSGKNWTAQVDLQFHNPGDYFGVCKHLILVAVGNNLCSTSSTNGVTWAARVIPAGIYRSVIWIGDKFVAVGDGVCATSANGIAWVARSFPLASANRVTWTGTRAVAIGNQTCATSTNGIDWIEQVIQAENFKDLAWTGSEVVAIGFNCCSSSATGVAPWTAHPITEFGALSVGWNGKILVAVGAEGECSTSRDRGVSWQMSGGFERELIGSGDCKRIVWGDTKWAVICSISSAAYTSVELGA
jgi:hypothetical protein